LQTGRRSRRRWAADEEWCAEGEMAVSYLVQTTPSQTPLSWGYTAVVEPTVEHRRGVCVPVGGEPPRPLARPLARYRAAGLLRVEIGPKRHLIVSKFTSGRRFQSLPHLHPPSICAADSIADTSYAKTRCNGTLELYARTPDMNITFQPIHETCMTEATTPSCRHPRSKGDAVASGQAMRTCRVFRVRQI